MGDIENNYYKAFFENSLDMLCIADTEGYFLKLNPAWTATLGFSEEELRERPYIDFVHPDDRQSTIAESQKIGTSDYRTVSFINRYLCKDGSYKSLLWSSTRSQENKIMAVARDITEIKQRDQFYSEMQTVANIGSWKYYVNPNKWVWSEQTYKICEIPLNKEITEEDILNFAPSELQESFYREISKVLKGGQSFDVELPFTANRGTKKWVRLIGYPVLTGHKVVAVEGVAQDISSRKKTEKNLEIEKVKSFNASRLAALGEMAGSIAHEINNPLEIINLTAKSLTLLVEKPKLDVDALYENCERISDTVQRIATIIRGLQNLSRDGSNDIMEKVQIGDVLDDVLAACSQRFQSRGIRLEIVNEELCAHKIFCRKVELAQVLLNLLNNAFDATHEATEKWVRVRLSTINDNRCLRISIEDSGTGIDQQIVDKIMDPFFTTKPMGRGTGLGLSISKAIANKHDGNLEFVGNKPYTEFALSLPVAEV